MAYSMSELTKRADKAHQENACDAMVQPLSLLYNRIKASTLNWPFSTTELQAAFQTRRFEARGLLSFRRVLCVSLSLMVFVWGTTYKLSLYKAERALSPAKLCTRGSDAAKNALEQATDGRIVARAPIRITWVINLLVCNGDSRFARLRDQEAGTPLLLRLFPRLYLRPPPDEQRYLI
jgi:hypothetical protein